MTLPVPSQATFTVGEVLTAALMNSNVRDAVDFLANPPLFVAYQTSAQALTANTWVALALDTEITDTYGAHSNTTNNSRYTAQVAGWYLVGGRWTAQANASAGTRGTAINVNGSAVTGGRDTSTDAGTDVITMNFPGDLQFLNAGDYVEWMARSSVALSTNVTMWDSSVFALWVHA